ncbi:phage tail protein [Photobacterium damselae subsp. damselae]|uniref:phage tail-collar fiber domain-containing protein n=1 Tax=Photobacterium damselae TaxID=38293 RepID=UPI001F321B1B|nr:phage tail protein [Photobacterium damselae]UJZ95062.1 phage tail protein [Photobacterium damselae subsp. damselae]UJZ99043.1 phage tail protein [Photobacterium damselae subsp. damselae]
MTQDYDPNQYAVLTDIGVKKLNDLLLGQTLTITHMVFGDGNGRPVTPTPSGTALINQFGQEPITETLKDNFGAGVFMSVEILEKYKGKWLREVGLVDSDGDLIVWACYAPALLSMYNEQTVIVHMPIIYENKITIQIDTAKQYVTTDVFNSTVDEIKYEQKLAGNEIEKLKTEKLDENGTIAQANTAVSKNGKYSAIPKIRSDNNSISNVFTPRWGDIRFVMPAAKNTFLSTSILLHSKEKKQTSQLIMSGFIDSNGTWTSSYAINIGNFSVPSIRFGYAFDNVVGIRPAFLINIPDYRTIDSPSFLWSTIGTGGLSNGLFDVSTSISLNQSNFVDVIPSHLLPTA